MIRALAAACLLAGCSTQPAFRRADPADPSPPPSDFARPAGASSSRPAGSVLSADPPLVRLTEPGRAQPEGVPLVARDAGLRPVALLRVAGRRGSVAQVRVERGSLRPGQEVVEPSPALAEEAGRLPPAR